MPARVHRAHGVAHRRSACGRRAQAEKHRGVNIYVEREGGGQASSSRGNHRDWVGTPAMPMRLPPRCARALIGDARPHDAQHEVLERLAPERIRSRFLEPAAANRSASNLRRRCGRCPAARRRWSSIRLRALANDQYEALRRTLEPLGVRCFRANGSIESGEREELFAALAAGAWDLVLATPEFLEFHRDALRGAGAPSLVVVDEAHHLHESRHRPSYARLAATLESLGKPQVLALTATAAEDAFRRIVEELAIDAWVIDPTVRENLEVIDARETRDKHAYLVELFARGEREKGIVYCNSRAEATSVARRLRRELGDEVMFYHARMPNADRLNVERYFREGVLRVVVATSAFGEGIDLPDVANVVLYHLNFDFGEFNQQAGRAGRDGNAAASICSTARKTADSTSISSTSTRRRSSSCARSIAASRA